MPKGNATPSDLAKSRLTLLERQLKKELSLSTFQKLKQALTGKPVDGGRDWDKIRRLRRAHKKRSLSISTNMEKLNK